MDQPANGSGIGQPVRRREDLRLVRGGGRYTADENLPGQVYAVDAALAARACAHPRDRDRQRPRPSPACSRCSPAPISSPTASSPFRTSRGRRIRRKPRSPTRTASRRSRRRIIRCRPTKRASSARQSRWWSARPSMRRRTAPSAVVIDYDVLPAVVETAAAARQDAPRRARRHPLQCLLRLRAWRCRRDRRRVRPRRACHALRDLGAARHRRADGAARRARRFRRRDADALPSMPAMAARCGSSTISPPSSACPPEQVRVLMQDVGGNFGTRGMIYPEFALVAWAARKLGRPVKWITERSESFLSDYQARDLVVEAELALDDKGKFLAMRGSNLGNLGAHTTNFAMVQKGVQMMSSIYRVPAAHFRARATLSNTSPTRPYRSAGRPEVIFVDGAADRSRGARMRLRPRRDPPQQSGDAKRSCRTKIRSASSTTTAIISAAWIWRSRLGDWAGFRSAASRGEEARQISRHRRRQLRRHLHRRAAREGRDHGVARRLRRARHRHRFAGPGPRDELCPTRHRMARRADRGRALRRRRHRPRHGRRRRPFRPRHAARLDRHQEILRRHHRKRPAHRRASVWRRRPPTSNSRTAASP